MLLRHEPRATKRAGFTLMEMLIVVAIIVVLAGVGGVIYMNVLGESKGNVARAQARNIAQACQMFNLSHGRYPNSLAELTEPMDNKAALMEPQYLRDPWQMEYKYANPGSHQRSGGPDVWSDGPPGDPAAPYGNW